MGAEAAAAGGAKEGAGEDGAAGEKAAAGGAAAGGAAADGAAEDGVAVVLEEMEGLVAQALECPAQRSQSGSAWRAAGWRHPRLRQ